MDIGDAMIYTFLIWDNSKGFKQEKINLFDGMVTRNRGFYVVSARRHSNPILWPCFQLCFNFDNNALSRWITMGTYERKQDAKTLMQMLFDSTFFDIAAFLYQRPAVNVFPTQTNINEVDSFITDIMHKFNEEVHYHI